MKRGTTPELPRYLTGWKEIATYLGRGVRTVQRYERQIGLPVHRPAGKSIAAVIATKAELDAWVMADSTRADRRGTPAALNARLNRVAADFLRIDSEIALTFSGLALTANDPEKRSRRVQTARRAYDTIVQLSKNIDLSHKQRDQLDASLQRLKTELQSLGQTFLVSK